MKRLLWGIILSISILGAFALNLLNNHTRFTPQTDESSNTNDAANETPDVTPEIPPESVPPVEFGDHLNSTDKVSLTVKTEGCGIVNISNSGPYNYGDIVELTAIPAPEWHFSCWKRDFGGHNNPIKFMLETNMTIVAQFLQDFEDMR